MSENAQEAMASLMSPLTALIWHPDPYPNKLESNWYAGNHPVDYEGLSIDTEVVVARTIDESKEKGMFGMTIHKTRLDSCFPRAGNLTSNTSPVSTLNYLII